MGYYILGIFLRQNDMICGNIFAYAAMPDIWEHSDLDVTFNR